MPIARANSLWDRPTKRRTAATSLPERCSRCFANSCASCGVAIFVVGVGVVEDLEVIDPRREELLSLLERDAMLLAIGAVLCRVPGDLHEREYAPTAYYVNGVRPGRATASGAAGTPTARPGGKRCSCLSCRGARGLAPDPPSQEQPDEASHCNWGSVPDKNLRIVNIGSG